jgi:hypothetical protein
MTKLVLLPLLFLLSMSAFAQTTYTTTANACSGKINQMCTLPVRRSEPCRKLRNHRQPITVVRVYGSVLHVRHQ